MGFFLHSCFFRMLKCCVNIIFCRRISDTGQNNENKLWCGNSLEWIAKLCNWNFVVVVIKPRIFIWFWIWLIWYKFNDSAFGYHYSNVDDLVLAINSNENERRCGCGYIFIFNAIIIGLEATNNWGVGKFEIGNDFLTIWIWTISISYTNLFHSNTK